MDAFTMSSSRNGNYHDQVGHARNNTEAFNRSLLRAIQEASPDGILVVDEQALVVTYNQRFLDVWRIPPEHARPDKEYGGAIPDNTILQAATDRVKHPESFRRRVQELYADPTAHDHCEIEFKDGRTIERHSVGLYGEDGQYLGRVWFFRDITEHKQAEAALQALAYRDPLTGLLNRRHFFERAAEELMRARRHHRPLAILMLDMDHFKHINDRYGHAAGDSTLQIMAAYLSEILRNEDLVARIGGEEFAVLMPDNGLDKARTVAERLRVSIAEHGIPTEEDEIFCTVSVGIAIVSHTDNCIEDALRRADAALYRAKAGGRNRVETEL